MIPTPSLSHFTTEDYSHFYEPAEDSFLLIDALEKDLEFLRKLKPTICLEIGSGSGIVSTALASTLKDCYYLTTDLNFKASAATKMTSTANGVCIEPICAKFASPLRVKPDLVIFNPPYVPTDDSELFSADLLTRTWAGGKNGRVVIDEFLELLPGILGNKGVCYLLILRENRKDEILDLLKRVSFSGEVVLKRRAGRENLEILRIQSE